MKCAGCDRLLGGVWIYNQPVNSVPIWQHVAEGSRICKRSGKKWYDLGTEAIRHVQKHFGFIDFALKRNESLEALAFCFAMIASVLHDFGRA